MCALRALMDASDNSRTAFSCREVLHFIKSHRELLRFRCRANLDNLATAAKKSHQILYSRLDGLRRGFLQLRDKGFDPYENIQGDSKELKSTASKKSSPEFHGLAAALHWSPRKALHQMQALLPVVEKTPQSKRKLAFKEGQTINQHKKRKK